MYATENGTFAVHLSWTIELSQHYQVGWKAETRTSPARPEIDTGLRNTFFLVPLTPRTRKYRVVPFHLPATKPDRLNRRWRWRLQLIFTKCFRIVTTGISDRLFDRKPIAQPKDLAQSRHKK
jgi:hypothetical protein